MTGRLFVLGVMIVTFGIASSPMPARAAAAPGPPTSVQQNNQIVVVAPLFGVDGNSASDCAYVGSGSCVAALFAGGVIVSINWPPFNGSSSCQNCAKSVVKYAVYRVPPGTSVGSVAERAKVVLQTPPQQIPALASHVLVASGSWQPSGFIPQTFAIVPSVKVGECFVARVSASGNWQSADSNEVCITSSTKFGTETVDFAPLSSYGFSFARNLQPASCYQTYLQDSQPSSAGPVGWQSYSHAVPPSSVPCVGTQVLYSAYNFDLGATEFPIQKAELIAGGAACVSEIDIGPSNTGGGGVLGGIYKTWTKHTMAVQPSLDQDVTSMLTPPSMASQSKFAFVLAPSLAPPPATIPGQCVGTVSGVTLKVTRLRQ
jgi:hypothetical protein